MAGIVITALLAISMWLAIWLLTGRLSRTRQRQPTPPGQLTAAERKRLYKRLGIDPALLAQRPRHDVATIAYRPTQRPRRSTEA